MPWWVWAIVVIAIAIAVTWLKNQIRRGRYTRYDKDLSDALDIIGQTLQRRKVLLDKWNNVQHLPDDALVQQNPPVTKRDFVQAALIDRDRQLNTVLDAQFRFERYRAPESFEPVQVAMLSLFMAARHELRVSLDDVDAQAATYANTQNVIAAYNKAYREALAGMS